MNCQCTYLQSYQFKQGKKKKKVGGGDGRETNKIKQIKR